MENCEPTAIASDVPSSIIRRQFHSTTSRGAYSVCATAIAVNTAPNAGHAAPISGSVCHTALAWIIAGEKQYNVSATNPPAFPHSRRATYHSDAPSNIPQARNGSRGSHRQYTSDSPHRSGQTSNGAAVVKYGKGECSESNRFEPRIDRSAGSKSVPPWVGKSWVRESWARKSWVAESWLTESRVTEFRDGSPAVVSFAPAGSLAA